jgi:hypothetical protein
MSKKYHEWSIKYKLIDPSVTLIQRRRQVLWTYQLRSLLGTISLLKVFLTLILGQYSPNYSYTPPNNLTSEELQTLYMFLPISFGIEVGNWLIAARHGIYASRSVPNMGQILSRKHRGLLLFCAFVAMVRSSRLLFFSFRPFFYLPFPS